MKEKRLAALDGLRGFAAAHIVVYHAWGETSAMHPAVQALTTPVRHGLLGVPLMLLMSGFVLTHSRILRDRSGRGQGTAAFLMGRLKRIGLPYYAALGVFLVLPVASLVLGRESSSIQALTARNLLSHLVFLHGLWPDTLYSISTPLWTMSVIFQFYLLFPLLLPAIRRFGSWPVVLVALAVSTAWNLWLPDGYRHLASGLILGHLSTFILGMAVAIWFHRQNEGQDAEAPLRPLATGAVLVLAAAIGLRAATDSPVYGIVYAIGYALLVMAVLRSVLRGGPLGRVAATPALVRIGMFSYSLYLIHDLALMVTLRAGRAFLPEGVLLIDLMTIVLLPAAAIGAGYVFYQLVEGPIAAAPKRRPAPVSRGEVIGLPAHDPA